MRLFLRCVLIPWLAIAGPLPSVRAAPVPLVIHARAVAATPTEFGADVWQETSPICDFKRVMGEGPLGAQTGARAVWSETMLCLWVRMDDPDAQKLAPKTTIWESDRIELILDPQPDDPAYCLFAVDCAGNRDEGLFGSPDYEEPIQDWSPAWTAVVARSNNAWYALLRIPYDILGAKPSAGAAWKINLCRQRNPVGAPAEFSAWDSRFGGFHFAGGTVIFDPPSTPQRK